MYDSLFTLVRGGNVDFVEIMG